MKIELELTVEQTLVLSTAHLSDKTMDALREEDPGMPWTIGYEHGWLVYCGDETLPEGVEYADLRKCLDFARKHGCMWVRFDGDHWLASPFSVYRYG